MAEMTVQELREVQLSILDKIDYFCRRNALTYHLAFGTLLGAVRYGTYIPWDDDLDLMMPREDYTKFCATFPAEHPDLTIGAPEVTGSSWAYPYAKVSDGRTSLVEDIELDHDLGVNVDIFPIDHCAASPRARQVHFARLRFLKGLLVLKSLTPREGRSRHRALVRNLAKPLVRAIPTGTLTRSIARAAVAHHGQSVDVSVFVGPYEFSVKEATIASSRDISFEGRMTPAPIGHHEVLSAIYGTNYMQPPPVEKQVTHHRFTATWKVN